MPALNTVRNRKEIIKDLQTKRGSKILCYVTSDRISLPPNIPGINTQLSTQVQPFVHEHLEAIGETKTIDLFLYTRGGMTNSVLPLVNLLRNYCKKLNVLVPFVAHSAGTLICLGANNVVMGKMGELSPIDPTTANQFNPRIIPGDINSPQVGISVEDVFSFFELSNDDKIGKKFGETMTVSAFNSLTSSINPLALGNVYRIYQQIRLISKKLLKMHIKKIDDKKLDLIVEAFVKKFFSHDYSIGYEETASILGKNIVKKTNSQEEALMNELLEHYSNDLKLKDAFNLNQFMGDEKEKEFELKGAYFESENQTHLFKTVSKVTQRQEFPSNMHIQIQPGQDIPYIPGFPKAFNLDIIYQGWNKI